MLSIVLKPEVPVSSRQVQIQMYVLCVIQVADTQLTTHVTGSSVRGSARVHNTVQVAFKPRHKTSSQRPGPSVARALKFETPAVSAHPQSASRVQDWIDHVQVPAQAGINQHQIKPLELPKFDGLQKNYVRWRQRFMRLVDDAGWLTMI